MPEAFAARMSEGFAASPFAGMKLAHSATLMRIARRQHGNIEDCAQRMVLLDSSKTRRLWNVCLFCCLAYTGTVLPYRLAFIEFNIPESIHSDDWWNVIEGVIDVLFVVDLLICFICSYRDDRNKEIVDIRLIISRYLRTFFAINLVACIPPDLVGEIITLFNPDSSNADGAASIHKTMRITRLQRMSRLARLIRLVRMSKMVSFFLESPLVAHLRSLRGIRIMNFFAALLWVVHLTACVWYLAAALHTDHTITWVGQTARGDGIPVLEKEPVEKWIYAMYFVLTVFTTVGFGDMSANTIGEMWVVMVIMMIGAVVNGIVLSEVINLITTVDQAAREIYEQKELIEGFAEHTHLRPSVKKRLVDWISETKTRTHQYNRSRMKDMLTGAGMPRHLTGKLPKEIFEGKLLQNKFITLSNISGKFCIAIPHRFPLLLALASNTRCYDQDEIVFHCWDQAWNIFLVLAGVFSAIAQQAPSGRGLRDLPPMHGSFAATEGDELYPVSAPSSVSNAPSPAVFAESGDASIASGKAMETCATTNSGRAIQARGHEIVPFRLFSFGNYFGDTEILLPGNLPRRFTVRCEAHQVNSFATVLVLHKKALFKLMGDFPQIFKVWKCISERREAERVAAQATFKTPSSGNGYKDVGASIIQRHWRGRSKSPSFVLGCMKHTASMGTVVERSIRVTAYTESSGQCKYESKFHGGKTEGSAAPEEMKRQHEVLDKVCRDVTDLQERMIQMDSKMDTILQLLQPDKHYTYI